MTQVFKDLDFDFFEIVAGVEVFHVVRSYVEAVIGAEIFVVFVDGDLGVEFLSCCESGFECPCSADVAHGIASSTEQQQREAEGFHVLDAVGMAAHGEVEGA